MPSLSSYDKNTRRIEGKTINDDFQAGYDGMDALLSPIRKYNQSHRKKYTPRKIFLCGNHEHRVDKHVNANPELYGTISDNNFRLRLYGWESYPFLTVVEVDGVAYSHYFYNPNTGKPWSGTANTMLNNVGFSFTMGHQQGRKEAEKHLANGKTIRALIVGSFYQHEEEYKGPQANNHWQGCVMKHEVKNGDYCLMELSMKYLIENWS